jgi:hypothetical protein
MTTCLSATIAAGNRFFSRCYEHCLLTLIHIFDLLRSCKRLFFDICLLTVFFGFIPRFLLFLVKCDNLVNLLEHFNDLFHILAILSIRQIGRLHFLYVFRHWHIGAFEHINCQVQVLQRIVFVYSFVVNKLLDLFLV